MFIVDSYSLAVIFCVITMLCWGSWGNTQKLAGVTNCSTGITLSVSWSSPSF